MTEGRKPSDDEVVAAVAKRGRGVTYVIRNILIMDKKLDPQIGTPYVLRRLKALEKAGRVERAPTSYAVQICWQTMEPRP